MLKNFVLETANAPGTSTTFNLGGAASGRLSFSGAGFTNGQLVFYVMDDGSQKEWGIGTFNTGSPNTMSRTTVIGNSAGTTVKLNFSGTTNVYNGLPAEHTLYSDNNNKVVAPGALTATGQLIGGGTTTNDNATSGQIGEYADVISQGTNATVTMTIASPCVVSWTGHGMVTVTPTGIVGCVAVQFSSTGALPTGLAAATKYYATVINANSFHVSTTPANALAGIYINTSGTQSGTQTCFQTAVLASNIPVDIAAFSLPAGDWEVGGSASATATGTNSSMAVWTNTVSDTAPSGPTLNSLNQWLGSFVDALPSLQAGVTRYLVSGPATVFLTVQAGLSSLGSAKGYLWARRRR